MRKANTQIVSTIKTKTLELLMEKNPDSISMRDIAANCSITAANIYHYYKDKDSLFQEISLDCLHELNERILNRVQNLSADKKKLQTAAHTFRDWCFENPRRALLVIQGRRAYKAELPARQILSLMWTFSCLGCGAALKRFFLKSVIKNIGITVRHI